MNKINNEKGTGYPHIDKPWEVMYEEKVLNAALPEGNLYEYMYEQTKDVEHKYCLNFFGKRISYKEFYKKIDDTAAALSKLGVKEGDVVSICILTMPENYYLLYAVNMLGAICNYVAVNNSVEEIRKRVISTNSKYVFTINLAEKNVIDAVGDSKDITIVSIPIYNSMPFMVASVVKHKSNYTPSSRVIEWKAFLNAGKNSPINRVKGNANSPAIIEYTSGTTGESKGALHPNQTANQIAYNYSHMGELMVFNDGERFLNILPPFYAYGIFVGTHMPICLGVEVYLCPNPEPEAVAKDFKKCKPHHFTGGPLHINAIMEDKDIQKMDLSFLQTVAFGGDSVNDTWIESVNEFLSSHGSPNKVIAGYGMTEMAGTFCTGTQKDERMLPFPKNNMKVVDVDTLEDKKFMEEGEIYITGPTLMNGYFKQDNLTEEAIVIDGETRWLKTGDLGYVTPDGELVISGRLKRIYWTGGEDGIIYRVYPMKIEQVIDEHENVVRSAVVGIKNKDKGYLTFAVIVLDDDGKKEKTIAEVKAHCEAELDSSSWPFKYRVVDALPMTPAGKVDYKRIEDMLTNQE